MPNIEELLKELNTLTYSAIDEKNADPRLIGVAIEANQRYIEHLEDVQLLPLPDRSVTVKVDGTTIRFDGDRQFAEWLSGRME